MNVKRIAYLTGVGVVVGTHLWLISATLPEAVKNQPARFHQSCGSGAHCLRVNLKVGKLICEVLGDGLVKQEQCYSGEQSCETSEDEDVPKS